MELAVDTALVALFAAAVSRFDGTVIRFVDAAASTTLGTYIAHPYVVHVPAYLRLVHEVRRHAGELASLVVIYTLAATFQFLIGPIFNAVVVAALRRLFETSLQRRSQRPQA